MNNWKVSLVNTIHPFDMVSKVVAAETVSEALVVAEAENQPYFARSACFHSSYVGAYYDERSYVGG